MKFVAFRISSMKTRLANDGTLCTFTAFKKCLRHSSRTEWNIVFSESFEKTSNRKKVFFLVLNCRQFFFSHKKIRWHISEKKNCVAEKWIQLIFEIHFLFCFFMEVHFLGFLNWKKSLIHHKSKKNRRLFVSNLVFEEIELVPKSFLRW